MQRSFVLLVLSVLSVTFLWLQIYVLNNIEHNNKDIFGLFPKLIRGWATKKQAISLGNGLKVFLREFTVVCTKNGINFFIIDSVTLQSFTKSQASRNTENGDPNKCFHLCHNNSISIGLLAKHWNTDILNDLNKMHTNVVILSGQDPRLVDLEGATIHLIPLHLFFSRNGIVIHVVLFYERDVLGLWHGALSQQDVMSQNIFSVDSKQETMSLYEHFQNERVYDKFSLSGSTVDGITVQLPSDVDLFLKDSPGSRFLPCNYKRAKGFYSKYGDDESGDAKKFRKRGRDVLNLAKINLDRLGVRFWLSSGTCLGWFRQCNIISHGKDMDIGIWIKDYNKDLIEEFQRDGIYLHHILGKVEDSYQMSFRTIDDVSLDIFFFYEEGTYMWNGGTRAKTGTKYKYIFPNFSLCWTEFLGMKVRVPCETQAYIEANYGETWAVPIKEWDWKKSPSNVIENGVWDKKDLPEVIQFFEVQ